MTKIFGRFFVVLSSVTSLRKQFKVFTSYSDNYCATYESLFVGPEGLLKTKIFEKKRIISSEKNIVAHFFSWYRTLQMS